MHLNDGSSGMWVCLSELPGWAGVVLVRRHGTDNTNKGPGLIKNPIFWPSGQADQARARALSESDQIF